MSSSGCRRGPRCPRWQWEEWGQKRFWPQKTAGRRDLLIDNQRVCASKPLICLMISHGLRRKHLQRTHISSEA